MRPHPQKDTEIIIIVPAIFLDFIRWHSSIIFSLKIDEKCFKDDGLLKSKRENSHNRNDYWQNINQQERLWWNKRLQELLCFILCWREGEKREGEAESGATINRIVMRERRDAIETERMERWRKKKKRAKEMKHSLHQSVLHSSERLFYSVVKQPKSETTNACATQPIRIKKTPRAHRWASGSPLHLHKEKQKIKDLCVLELQRTESTQENVA